MVQFTAPVLAQLLEAAPDATVCVTRDGRIQLVNAQAEQLFGYRRADLIGRPVEILVPEAAKARHVDLRTRYADDPRPRLIDARTNLSARRADGTTFPAEISLSAIHANEEILISAAVRDVTAQWQARDQLRRANEDLRWIIRSMAHDLRTPLRALAGFSATLTEEYADALGDTGRSYTGRIEAASEHMGHVLDALLNLASTARADIHPRQVDLAALAAGIADELQLADPARSVRFTIQRPLPALADPALIRTVLANLLGNAWKFTSGRDDATIEFGAMPASDAGVCYYVRDNGVGFDAAYVDKLFKPFERLHAASDFPGTGIGLASVRQIIDRHQGAAWAEATPGRGATIYFTLHTGEYAAALS